MYQFYSRLLSRVTLLTNASVIFPRPKEAMHEDDGVIITSFVAGLRCRRLVEIKCQWNSLGE
jgi:hypothetical protein